MINMKKILIALHISTLAPTHEIKISETDQQKIRNAQNTTPNPQIIQTKCREITILLQRLRSIDIDIYCFFT